MRVILLPRVSSLKQARQGDSVDTQINRLKQHSKDKGDEIVGTYTDAGKSASISDDKMNIKFIDGKFIIGLDLNKRVGLKKALSEIDKDLWEGAKFTKWDRLSRNNILSKILQIYFERNNKKLIPIDDSNDPLLVNIKGVLGEDEINKMKDRVRDVRLNRFESGLFPARSPYGYKPIFKDKRIVGFKLNKKESLIVKAIFEKTAKGIGYKEICKEYKLKPQSYYNILKNKIYIGIVSFEGVEKKGNYFPIISKELFDEVNKNEI